ncbi:MAG: peptidylprolyl isomerase [Opitutales bacterium]
MSDQSPTEITAELTAGTVKFRLFPDRAPKAVENFVTHAKNGYYDDVPFHRVIKSFMIQGGDPTATGRGGQSIWGKPFKDECHKDLGFSKPGLLAMANAGPGTNGSQFFITTAATPWLNGNHTIFGEVIEGYEVIEKIENSPTDGSDRPLEKQAIVSFTF